MKTLKPIFILLILGAIVIVSFVLGGLYFTYMPMWDMMNYHYPISSYMADCLQHHILPLWCPYSYLGTPVFSDPSSGFWYPVNMLLYFLFGFDAYVLKVEYALHLVVAGIGMYNLAFYFTKHRKTAIVVAIVFPLSGFFVSSAHLFSFVYSMAWLPFVFFNYLKGCTTKQWKYFIYGGICMALCILGGYIVFAILSAYLLGAIFLYYVFSKRHNAVHLLLLSVLMATIAGVLCSGYLYSVLESLPQQARGDGLGIQSVMDNPFSPQSLLSLILPFSTVVNTPFFDTDMSMRNMYIGLMAIPLIYIGLRYGKVKQSWLLLTVAILFLLVSFGAYTPVRAWLYYNVPLMKMFRHPAIFRAGAVIALILIATQGLTVLCTRHSPKIKRDLGIATAIVTVLIGVAFLLAARHETIKLRFPDFSSVQSVIAFNRNNNIWANVIVQCAAQAILLMLVFIALILFKHRRLAIAISLLWVLDITVSIQMNLAGTVICDVPVKTFAEGAAALPNNFPIPKGKPISETIVLAPDKLAPMVYNTVIIRKEISHDGYNPFVLKSNKRFMNSALIEYVIEQPLLYTTPCIQPWSNYTSDSINNKLNKNALYADVPALSCAPSASNALTRITAFEPNAITARVTGLQPIYLTLLQNYYPGWQCGIDGKPVEIHKTNFTFMSVKVPAGDHTVVYEFKPAWIKPLVWLQIVLWLMVGCTLLCLHAWKRFS